MDAPYCEVAVPVPLRATFTYAVPAELRGAIVPGSRVLVPFRKKTLAGVVLRLTDKRPDVEKVRDVLKLIDLFPALPEKLVELGHWVAGYYLAPVGEVFRVMLPPLVEVRVVREVTLTTEGKAEAGKLAAEAEREVLERLAAADQPVDAAKLFRGSRGEAMLARLARRGWVEIRERTAGRKGRMQRIVAWAAGATSEAAEKSREAAERVRQILEVERGPLPLPVLLRLAGISRRVAERLIGFGMIEAWEEPVAPGEDPFDADFTPPAHTLNEGQERALGEIRAWLDARTFTTGLLFGVTGSGKTEIYLRSIQETLARGRTALVLVPEIALTLWVGRLCRAWFGARFEGVAVLHSALGDAERAREWWRVRRGGARVVVGTRSAVFAPLENLGLVIVDEEQESSYKQEETPRYHGRDTAIVRAKLEGAAALLGSATPSLESFHHARAGKYKLLTLDARVENRPLAKVEIVDLREEFRQTLRANPISSPLREGLTACLVNGTQALVLINRRGYSWFVLCRSCGAAIQCENCSISMTHHKQRNRLECHYCGAMRPVPKKCPKCESEYIHFFGEGSEQLEERLREEFSGARVARLDRDTVRTKRQYQQTLGAFAAGAIDILVGTQMLAKGHDFQRVTLVGVVAADASLALPDFRAAERTFQLLTQVAGRAGRGELAGTVLVQTYYPEHYAIADAARQDYPAFFERELHFRKMMAYPPFTALANVIVRDRKLERAIQWARMLGDFLAPYEKQGIRVLGPAAAPLAKLKGDHRFQFLLKSQRRSALTQALGAALDHCDKKEVPAGAVLVDVDPLSLL